MRAVWDTWSRELAHLRHGLVIKHPLSTLTFLALVAALAWWCHEPESRPDIPLKTGTVQVAPETATAPVVSAQAQAMVPATTESGLASSELLLKIAQVVCCTSIDFEEGGSVLSAQGRKALDALVPFFAEHLTAHLHLDSHTDNTGSPVAAKELSLSRAQAARHYLVSKGVQPYQLSARGFGAEQPLQDNNTPDGRKRNRRIEFRL
jgi:outer membrane protein OmpA-like peptidoglycan-associated protein